MFVTANGARLFFDVLNPKLEIVKHGIEDRPTLICLPGGPGGDHQTLRPFFDRFVSVAQVIYLDHRGSGRSDAGDPSTWKLDQWADDTAAFCDALGIREPIVLGVSGGAIIAQEYLARHPGHAKAAVLLNPCARMIKREIVKGFEELGGLEAGAAAEAMYTRGAMEDVPNFFRHCMSHYTRSRPAVMTNVASRASVNFKVSQQFFQTGGEAFRFDHREALSKVTCPVLMLAGAHDPVTRAEWGHEVAQALPAHLVEFVLFEDSSHMIALDEPEKLTATIERFVASVGLNPH